MVCLNLYALAVIKAVTKITTKIITILMISMKVNIFPSPFMVKYTKYFTVFIVEKRGIEKVWNNRKSYKIDVCALSYSLMNNKNVIRSLWNGV